MLVCAVVMDNYRWSIAKHMAFSDDYEFPTDSRSMTRWMRTYLMLSAQVALSVFVRRRGNSNTPAPLARIFLCYRSGDGTRAGGAAAMRAAEPAMPDDVSSSIGSFYNEDGTQVRRVVEESVMAAVGQKWQPGSPRRCPATSEAYM